MIQIPLTQIGSPGNFAKAVEAHRKALESHRLGPAGKPAPVASHWVEQVIARVPDTGPVATRGPDRFEVLAYEIVDDRPLSDEAAQAIQTLRETIGA